ncbi:uncharacterized protein TNCV_3816201 [Trichonephila clavipes]|nr:uncharacterized protein TNCV_3816201 [Trichonephila clavipes]
MVEAGWSSRRVTRQSGRSNYVVSRCWDQCIREMSFTRRPGSGHPRQTSRRENRHIVSNARVHNCFIGRHLGTGSSFTRGLCVFSNHTKAPG